MVFSCVLTRALLPEHQKDVSRCWSLDLVKGFWFWKVFGKGTCEEVHSDNVVQENAD